MAYFQVLRHKHLLEHYKAHTGNSTNALPEIRLRLDDFRETTRT